MKRENALVVLAAVVAGVVAARAAVYYADSALGDDAKDGLSEVTAWRSLDKINAADLKPGDTMLFRRGSVWRGQLDSKSGEPGNPVRYSAYGKGPKPCFLGSVSRSRSTDWIDDGNGIWRTKKQEPQPVRKILDFPNCGNWSATIQDGMKGSFRRTTENGETFMRATCTVKPETAKNVSYQLWGPEVLPTSDNILFTFRARASKPMTITPTFALRVCAPPWSTSHNGMMMDGALPTNGTWRTFSVLMRRTGANIDRQRLHFSIGADISVDGAFDFQPVSVEEAYLDPEIGFEGLDIGIFICDHGKRWGVKKWSKEELVNELDYWYDIDDDRVFVKLPKNPAEMFRSIELAKRRVVIPHGNRHDIIWDSLTVMYSGSFAFAGGKAFRLNVRNCDLGWIGGAVQTWRKGKDGKLHPVRYGNGVEYWSPSWSNTIERCRIWQVYDAALTPQTSNSKNPIHHITYRDNVIWQCEYSLEYWNHDPASYTADIVFEHNTCIDAGYVWSHEQRPNPNGAHVLSYVNAAPCTNIIIRNNIFCRTANNTIRVWDDWRYGAKFGHNLFWVPENNAYRYEGISQPYQVRRTNEHDRVFGPGPAEFGRYQRTMKMDVTSRYGEPLFMDEQKRDYRLRPDSPGLDLATDGGPVGARNMPGIDQDQSVFPAAL